MENVVLSFNIISAVLLVIVILIQKSEGGALGLGVSQDSFVSSRSAGNFFTKATAFLAAIFIITSITLTILSNEKIPTKSVLDIIEEKEESSEPTIPKSD
jgi:preprotein translocase subunit SecG|tara:strand:- start:91 stop:390 length:300 start_codon:yes stop_codon:yes gene_type:complete